MSVNVVWEYEYVRVQVRTSTSTRYKVTNLILRETHMVAV